MSGASALVAAPARPRPGDSGALVHRSAPDRLCPQLSSPRGRDGRLSAPSAHAPEQPSCRRGRVRGARGEHPRPRGRPTPGGHRAARGGRGPRPGRRGARGHRRCGAPPGPALGRPAGGPRPRASRAAPRVPAGRRRMPRALRCAAGHHRARQSALCSTCSGRSGPVAARVVVDVPGASASMPALLSQGRSSWCSSRSPRADSPTPTPSCNDCTTRWTTPRWTRPADARPQRPDLRLVTGEVAPGRGGGRRGRDAPRHPTHRSTSP